MKTFKYGLSGEDVLNYHKLAPVDRVTLWIAVIGLIILTAIGSIGSGKSVYLAETDRVNGINDSYEIIDPHHICSWGEPKNTACELIH
ncbi:hypothetical protein [Yersinia pseudotuberculosis]|uniref:hypothetical protein n=1 Tax=Yersinia pseudotuberculosis TaxID=633 RepID=UPI00065D8913|nr:hypothetical protein [Yersinia pseudotuberculosis]CRY70855.1 Uncharacterised protein [Yersinia pseudotuberculosis]